MSEEFPRERDEGENEMREENLSCSVNASTDIVTPARLIQNSHLPFAVRDGAIGRKGKNPIDTFQLMLGEMEGITPSGAEGITRKYPTFRKLMEAYDRVESEQRESGRGGSGGSQAMMEGLVADCQVSVSIWMRLSVTSQHLLMPTPPPLPPIRP